jgi:hypothetical protein
MGGREKGGAMHRAADRVILAPGAYANKTVRMPVYEHGLQPQREARSGRALSAGRMERMEG